MDSPMWPGHSKFLSLFWRAEGNLVYIWSSPQRLMWWRWLFYRKRKTRSILILHSISDMAPDPLMAFANLNCPPLSMCSRQWECLDNSPWNSFSAFTRCFQEPYMSLTWVPGKTTGHWDLENNANVFKNIHAGGVEKWCENKILEEIKNYLSMRCSVKFQVLNPLVQDLLQMPTDQV
jgi:hypothetical protein